VLAVDLPRPSALPALSIIPGLLFPPMFCANSSSF